MTGNPDAQTFVHVPLLLALAAALQAYGIYGGFVLVRSPLLTSSKGLLVAGLLVFGSVILVPLVRRLWRSSLIFRVKPDGLETVHQFLRTRQTVPWDRIQSVTRLPSTPFMPKLQFSVVSLLDGRELVIGPHIPRLSTLLAELRTRATGCRIFDPYPAEGA